MTARLADPRRQSTTAGSYVTAARAFEDTLRKLRVMDAGAPAETAAAFGSRAALLAAAGSLWSKHLGPLLQTRDVGQLLGGRTRQAVSDLAKRGRLLALPNEDGELRFPAFQFSETGRPYPVLAGVLRQFAEVSVSPYTLASWFMTPQALLGRKTPAWWLKTGRDPGLLTEAARRAAARLRH